jgi:glycolate oxidase
MMDKLAIQAAEDFAHAGYPRDAAAILLCELDGTNAEVSEYIMAVRKLLTDSGATEVRTAVDEAERQLFWKGRKSAFPAVGRISPDYYCMDGTIPRRQLPRVLQQISDWSKEYGLAVANVFHAGDGNLHPLILFDANQPGELQRTEEFGQRILRLCVEVGGTITGEHGVGMEKIDQMCVQFQSLELQQFHAIKHAFDPDALLNPGKAVPSLHRCAEFGAMHVHNGQLAHPELERY